MQPGQPTDNTVSYIAYLTTVRAVDAARSANWQQSLVHCLPDNCEGCGCSQVSQLTTQYLTLLTWQQWGLWMQPGQPTDNRVSYIAYLTTVRAVDAARSANWQQSLLHCLPDNSEGCGCSQVSQLTTESLTLLTWQQWGLWMQPGQPTDNRVSLTTVAMAGSWFLHTQIKHEKLSALNNTLIHKATRRI